VILKIFKIGSFYLSLLNLTRSRGLKLVIVSVFNFSCYLNKFDPIKGIETHRSEAYSR